MSNGLTLASLPGNDFQVLKLPMFAGANPQFAKWFAEERPSVGGRGDALQARNQSIDTKSAVAADQNARVIIAPGQDTLDIGSFGKRAAETAHRDSSAGPAIVVDDPAADLPPWHRRTVTGPASRAFDVA